MLYISTLPVIFYLTGLMFQVQGVNALFNLYVRPPEVKRLLGKFTSFLITSFRKIRVHKMFIDTLNFIIMDY